MKTKNTLQRLLKVVKKKKMHTQLGPHKFITNSLLLLPKKPKKQNKKWQTIVKLV